MSRSCHSATFSSAACSVAADHPRQAADPLAHDGLRLCGIALEPFCPSRERLLDLADLGPREVADLGRDRVSVEAQHRERGS